MLPLIKFEIEFPEGFDDYAWEVEAKGWLAGVMVIINNRRFRVIFYDPVRLAQEIESELHRSPAFFESNLVVVSQITRAHVEEAIASIVRTGTYTKLVHEAGSPTIDLAGG